MRLSEQEKSAIVSAVAEFDEKAQIYLFGSRIHEQKKGGDIDLLVLSEHLDLGAKLKIKARIFQSLEEQKIDIVIAAPDSPDPFVKMVLQDGKKL